MGKHLFVAERFFSIFQVDLAMDVEKALPRRLRKRLLPSKEVVRPNENTGLKRLFFYPPISGRDIRAALKPSKVSTSCTTARLFPSVYAATAKIPTFDFTVPTRLNFQRNLGSRNNF